MEVVIINEVAIKKIKSYMEEFLSEPTKYWDRYLFLKRSYQQSAAFEILNRVMDHPNIEADYIISKYEMDMVNQYKEYGDNDDKSLLYTCAIEVAEDLLKII